MYISLDFFLIQEIKLWKEKLGYGSKQVSKKSLSHGEEEFAKDMNRFGDSGTENSFTQITEDLKPMVC